MNDSKKTTKLEKMRDVQQEDLKARRKAIRQILIGSGVIVGFQVLPNTWTKPIIDSVMLSAHAEETSPPLLPDDEPGAPGAPSVPGMPGSPGLPGEQGDPGESEDSDQPSPKEPPPS